MTKKCKNILIVKTSSLGDIIHSYPTLEYLNKKFPEVNIDWVVEKPFQSLVDAHPYVRQVIPIDTKKWRKECLSRETYREILSFRRQLQSMAYDVVFDLQGNSKSGFVTGLASGTDKVGFALKATHEWPNILFTNHRYLPQLGQNCRYENLYLVQRYFNDFQPFDFRGITLKISPVESHQVNTILNTVKVNAESAQLVMVCPGSNWKNKQLTEQTWIDFLRKLQQEKGFYLLFTWGTETERGFVNSLQKQFAQSAILDKMSLPVLQNVMAKMDLVIAVDSLPLHLAGTTSTKTFSVFGASSAQKYKPIGEIHAVMQGTCPYGRTFERRCPVLRSCKTGACIRSLTGDAVYRSFIQP